MQNSFCKKALVVGIVAVFIGFGAIPSSGMQTDNKSIKLSNLGNILYVGGSGGGNYSTIQSAIDNANNGDTVFVYDDSSPYYENLIIDKSIILIGENEETTVIDGGGTGEIIYVSADNATIGKFTIQNSEFDGILISQEDHPPWDNEIKNANIYNNNIKKVSRGIFGITLQDSMIYGNKIDDIDTGIMLGYSSNNNISGNYITNARYRGIEIMGYFSLNEFYDKIHDLVYPTAKNNIIYRNTVENNRWGIHIWGGCINTKIIENNILDNHEIGIELYSSTNTEIRRNNFIQNENHEGYVHSFFTVINKFSQYFTNLWDENYWSGENYEKSIRINGEFIFIISFPLSDNDFLEMDVFNLPLIKIDWHPASEQYDI